MNSQPILSRVPRRNATATRTRGRDFVTLTRPGVVLASLLMAAMGLALAPAASATVLLATLAGTALLIGACGAFTAVVAEGDSGAIASAGAAIFGTTLFLLGALTLAEFATLSAAALGVVACLIYVGLYTPMRQRSLAAIPIGAGAGALPLGIGWFAAGGELAVAPVVLFAAIFVWQIPHLIAIELRRSQGQTENVLTAITTIRASALLLLVATIAAVLVAGGGYGLMILGTVAALGVLAAAMRSAPDPVFWSRRVFLASLVYLPCLALGSLVPF